MVRSVNVLMPCLFAVCAIACGSGKPTPDEGASRLKAKSARTANYRAMTAEEFRTEWDKNPIVAAEKYQTNGVEISGILHEISSAKDKPLIRVGGSRRSMDTQTCITVESDETFASLKKCEVGKEITIKARVIGTMGSAPWLIADELRAGAK